MALKYDIIISSERFNQLKESAGAFDKINKGEKFIHITMWETVHSNYVEIFSNDERIEHIKNNLMKRHEEQLATMSNHVTKLREENEKLKSGGLLKRLLSWL